MVPGAPSFASKLIPDFFKLKHYVSKHSFADGNSMLGTGKYSDGKAAYEGKRIYLPKPGDFLGTAAQVKEILGGKGAGLAEMTDLKLPVPPAAITPTSECENYYNAGKIMDGALREHVRGAIAEIEKQTGKKFFDYEGSGDILLISVRSGAKISMPGMMETVLNIGLNEKRVEQMIDGGMDARFVCDVYRRHLQYFGSVVLEAGTIVENGENVSLFERALSAKREMQGVRTDAELSVASLRELISEFKQIIKEAGKEVPQDPFEQAMAAVEAVFRSSYGEKAMKYKEKNSLPPEMPTAVIIQAMVFGNLNAKSGSGVFFTREKNTGEKCIYSDYLPNAQGEEVVSGVRTPVTFKSLKECPFDRKIGRQLFRIADRLEKHYRDMLDIEYTIENGRLNMLQVRTGKRSGKAAFKIACDLVDEKMITEKEAVKRITTDNVLSVLLPQIGSEEKGGCKADAKGVPASAGAGCGIVVFNAKKAAKIADDALAAGKKPPAMMFVGKFTKPEDYSGMIAAGKSGGGVLTAEGGPTSHAAVVCGGNGIPAVVGCRDLRIDIANSRAFINGKEVKEGDFVTIDGSTGEVFARKLALVPPELTSDFKRVIGWANSIAQLPVMANADTPSQARQAVELGAKGIGLCRTEHMFNDKSRIGIVQEMFLAETLEARQGFIDQLLPMQRKDFGGIFSEMTGKPVTIRLLDPPMHEFLPDLVKLERAQAGRDAEGKADAAQDALLERVRALHEENPMLGVRGVRLLYLHPEILDMQVKAIIEGALDAAEQGSKPVVKIMVPVVEVPELFAWARERIDKVAADTLAGRGATLDYKVGTMIEIPSACLSAGEMARHADFFSFGTNDLTQTGLGLSRDDTALYIARLVSDGRLAHDPFKTLHPDIAKLVAMTVRDGKAANPHLEIGICGEQGVDPLSIRKYLYNAGLDSVSGTPMRVPLAIIAGAQLELEGNGIAR